MQFDDSNKCVRVERRGGIKIIGYGCIVLFSLAAFLSWLAGGGKLSPFFLLFALLGLLCLLWYGSVEADEYVITYILPLGRFEIRWDEVESVEVDGQGHAMVFVGEQKRLPIMGPAYWGRGNKEELAMLITDQMEKRHIPFRHTQKAPYRLPKNTRVH